MFWRVNVDHHSDYQCHCRVPSAFKCAQIICMKPTHDPDFQKTKLQTGIQHSVHFHGAKESYRQTC